MGGGWGGGCTDEVGMCRPTRADVMLQLGVAMACTISRKSTLPNRRCLCTISCAGAPALALPTCRSTSSMGRSPSGKSRKPGKERECK